MAGSLNACRIDVLENEVHTLSTLLVSIGSLRPSLIGKAEKGTVARAVALSMRNATARLFKPTLTELHLVGYV
jgi:hypothetical protein